MKKLILKRLKRYGDSSFMSYFKYLSFFLFLYLSTAVAVKSTSPLTVVQVVYTDFPPYVISQPDPAKPRGVSVEVWEKYIAPAAHIKVEWVGPVSFVRAISLLKSGKVDAIFGAMISTSNQQGFIYPEKFRTWVRPGLMVLKKTHLEKITSGKDIADKSIGFMAGTPLGSFFGNPKTSYVRDELFSEGSFIKNLEKLKSERIWGIYDISRDTLLYNAARMGLYDQVKLVSFPESEKSEPASIALYKDMNPQLAKRIFNATDQSKAATSIDKMVQGYIDEAAKKNVK